MSQVFKDFLLLELENNHLTLEQYWQLIKLIVKINFNSNTNN